MSSIETFNIVNNEQFKSISNIERITDCLYIKLDYEYRLNLKIKLCESISTIYLHSKDIYLGLLQPLLRVLDDKSSVEVSIINNKITSKTAVYYDFIRHIDNKILQKIIKYKGCNYQLKLEYSVKNDKYIAIRPIITIKSFLINYIPEEIQPELLLLLTFEDAYNFIDILASL